MVYFDAELVSRGTTNYIIFFFAISKMISQQAVNNETSNKIKVTFYDDVSLLIHKLQIQTWPKAEA